MSCRPATWASVPRCGPGTAWTRCPSPATATRWPSPGGRSVRSPSGISGETSTIPLGRRQHPGGASLPRGKPDREAVGLRPEPEGQLVDFDLILKDGWVIDGSGGPPFRADVGLLDTMVAAVGRLDGSEAAQILDAAGR